MTDSAATEGQAMTDSAATDYGAGRRCARCGKLVSRYNPPLAYRGVSVCHACRPLAQADRSEEVASQHRREK